MFAHAWGLAMILVPFVVVAGDFKHVDHKHWTDKYDRQFRKYSKHYFGPLVNWRWFKAQGIAESGLNPKAKSKSGATGIMQILPSTFEYIRTKNKSFLSIEDPKWNIAAGIYYDRYLYNKWKFLDLDVKQQLFFTFGSYNAGFRRIRNAYNKTMKKQGEVRRWEPVASHAPGQTRRYVRRIRKLMQEKI